MGCLKIEQFRVLFLNKKNILIADEIVATGTIDQTPVYPREIVKRSLFHEAGAIILVHNHPSGNLKPSKADIDLTTQIINACNITDQEKLYYNSKVRELIKVDIGCIQMGKFVDITGQTRSGYIVYKECGDEHHIEDEIRNFTRLYTHNKEIRKKIKESIYTQLHQFSRTGYMAYLHMKDLATEIFSALETKYPDDFDHNKLEYNQAKGQFYVNIPDTKKVGIYIETS